LLAAHTLIVYPVAQLSVFLLVLKSKKIHNPWITTDPLAPLPQWRPYQTYKHWSRSYAMLPSKKNRQKLEM